MKLQEYNDINYTILDEKDVREYLYDIINNKLVYIYVHPILKYLNGESLSLLTTLLRKENIS